MNEEQKNAIKIVVSFGCCLNGSCEMCLLPRIIDEDGCDGIGSDEFAEAIEVLKKIL